MGQHSACRAIDGGAGGEKSVMAFSKSSGKFVIGGDFRGDEGFVMLSVG
jgi:hypothetical protein